MKAAIVMGSISDLPVLEKAIDTLKEFGVEVEAHVMSAHRTPDKAHDFASNADQNGIDVIIAAAGKAAHLAGVVAAYTTLPVIGLPVKSSTMDGLDSLLSTVNMPGGIPVLTLSIGKAGAINAALAAAEILALSDDGMAEKVKAQRAKQKEKVLAARLPD